MDKRSYESPMDWEYQSTGPMDPSSPFAQSTKKTNENTLGSASAFTSYSQNGFARLASSPTKALTTSTQQMPSIFSSSRGPKATAATPFRNATFTTPRKPFDIDVTSPTESSPAVTEASELPETPDHDQSFDFDNMALIPVSVSRHKTPLSRKANGKGEISKVVFPMRDKVRKRKRYNADKDVSGYRLPYIHPAEVDGSEYESDDSTFQPNRSHGQRKDRRKEGWISSFFATVQRHPHVPGILGYWLNLTFSAFSVCMTIWVGWIIFAGLREDFATARSSVRTEVLQEIDRCRADYINNKCYPVQDRLPAVYALCEQWFNCMNQNPDNVQKVQLGAKSIVQIINEIVDTMSYKTLFFSFALFIAFLLSGRSLYRSASDLPDFARHVPSAYNQPHPSQQAAPQQIYWQAIQPQTPRHQSSRRLPPNDETPETDASPPKFQAILPPETPKMWRSPSKRERSRSPTKRY
ncbi:hypothetical protein GGR50DRAFT_651374 [Xylaria sp. CBS 124048]|nr:hypothetical protein GGR50DRAFT_651374 [Xylaria sp. CBS 124048]